MYLLAHMFIYGEIKSVSKSFEDVTIDVALKHVGELSQKSYELAYAIYRLLEGDDGEHAAQLLEKYCYVDENGEWIYA